jgi:hypothetical protein
VASPNYFQFPLRPTPQTFAASLLGVTYNFRTWWSPSQTCWCVDIADVDNVPVVGSIPLVTGADLLEQYEYLGIGGGLVVYDTAGPPDSVPGYADLGVTGQLLFFAYD